MRTHHRDGDTGVARGGLHHGVALLEKALALGVLDHRDGETVDKVWELGS